MFAWSISFIATNKHDMFISTIIQYKKKSLLRCQTLPCHRNVSSWSTAELDATTTTSDYITWVGKSPNPIPLLHEAIKRCSRTGFISEGKASHAQTITVGLKSDTLTSNMIVNMYSKCNLVGDARKVFDGMRARSMVSWNTMIGSLAKSGDEREALGLFSRMHRESRRFSEFTVSSVLCACAGKASVSECRQLHCFSVKTATDSNVFVATALLDVYAKNGHVSDSVAMFESMPERTRTPVSWSSMLAGLVQNGSHEEALALFRRCPEIDAFAISSAVRACSGLASILEGAQVHAVSLKSGLASNQFVACSLVDMYGKCGALGEAYAAFHSAENKTVICWNAVIAGFARHARSLEAMVLFEKMQMTGLSPNEVTYVSVLSACGHAGLVESGRRYFELMTCLHGVSPGAVHYSAMVDILARAGLVNEAHGLIEGMPFEPTPPMWGSLLASCRVHGNLELAEKAAEQLLELEPENAGNRVLLSNVYAANKKWDLVARTRKGLRESDTKKEKGKSWIEVKSAVHSFTVGERNHPRMVEIYANLEELVGELKKLGYTAKSDDELHDVVESEKSELLSHHSEKLALTFGLMCLPPKAPIRIMKNLRICGDCHSFMKFASGLTEREIIVRDTNRFHHFKNGCCSCREFW